MNTTTLEPTTSLANIERIHLTREEAQNALAKYRAALKTCGQHPFAAEDDTIIKAYRALSKGRPIIDLREAISHGGAHTDGLPKFAVCRADMRNCHCHVKRDGSVMFAHDRQSFGGWGRARRGFMDRPTFDAGTLPQLANGTSSERNGMTLVPMVPAPLRPPNKLSGYLTLWEVEQWTTTPPLDPFLLRWLGSGFLCVVVAMWNLTPLERAVMRSSLIR